MEKRDTQRPKSPGQNKQNKASTTSVNNNSTNNGGQSQLRSSSPSRQSKFALVPSPPSAPSQKSLSGYPGAAINNIRQQLALLGSTPSQGSSVNGNARYSPSKPNFTPSKGSVIQSYPGIDPKTFPRALSHTVGNRASTSKSLVGIDRSRNIRAFVEKAISERKVFTCVGVYPAIKNALKKRGWVEKTGPLSVVRSANTAMFRGEYMDRVPDEETDAAWIARNLRDYPPDFIWVIRRDNIDFKNMHNNQVINRFPKAWFTTKVGLVACLQQMHWFSEAGIADTFFPRCYRLCLEDERQAFQEDFRLTACMSYLRHFIELFEARGPGSMIDSMSKITPLSIDFASRQLGNYIRMRRHEDIDWLLPPNFMSQHWEAFIHQYYLVVHDKKKIRFDSQETVKIKYEMAKKTLQRIGQYWPQAHLDGVFNMWICKPGARSRGKGIVIMNTLEKIMELLSHTNYREANWVVQKYMERPMLVYKTKFDIRQWFIITDWSPLTVWFYKESYIRFCTKPYVLEDFHESIHLCNNAIQCRYQNSELRDTALPDENMWDCYTFQAYLKTIGKMDQWSSIYSGMKQAIIGVLLASQETVESRKNCFELYGADFMLSEDYKPWLIEINSCPCMAASTSVTARMCAQCLEDCIKVVVDRKANKNADTGMFEMVYRQNPSSVTVQQFSGHDLIIHGKKLTRDIDWPSMMSNKTSSQSKRNLNTNISSPLVRQPSVPPVSDNLTFADLLQKLRMKNAQMFAGFVSNTQAQTLAAVSNPNGTDIANTGPLLNKLRSLNHSKNNNDLIPGIKNVYPSNSSNKSGNKQKQTTVAVKANQSKPSTDIPLAFLSKYGTNNSNNFADLVRIGKQMSEDNNELRRPGTSSVTKQQRQATPNRNPYLPNSTDIANGNPKTLEQVKAMSAALSESEKYGKIRADLVAEIEKAYANCIINSENSDNLSHELTRLGRSSSNESIDFDPSSSNSEGSLNSHHNFLTSDYPSRSKKKRVSLDRGKVSKKLETESRINQSPLSSPLSSSSPSSPIPLPTSQTPQNEEITEPELLVLETLDQDVPIVVSEVTLIPGTTSAYMIYPIPPSHDNETIDIENPIPSDDSHTDTESPEPLEPNHLPEDAPAQSPDTVETALLIDLETPPSSRPMTPSPITETIPDGTVYDILNNNLFLPELVRSNSESDSLSEGFDFCDPDLAKYFIPACSRTEGPSAVGFHKPRPRSFTKPRISKFSKFPCHRVSLPSQNSLKLSGGRRSGATLPLKKINLKLT